MQCISFKKGISEIHRQGKLKVLSTTITLLYKKAQRIFKNKKKRNEIPACPSPPYIVDDRTTISIIEELAITTYGRTTKKKETEVASRVAPIMQQTRKHLYGENTRVYNGENQLRKQCTKQSCTQWNYFTRSENGARTKTSSLSETSESTVTDGHACSCNFLTHPNRQ